MSITAAEEIAGADWPQIRLYTVGKAVAYGPRPTASGKWSVCTPQTIRAGVWNGFSAVGYFFGRELHKNLKIPIGLIHSSWGGTPAEAWTSAQALEAMPDYRPQLTQLAGMEQAESVGGQALARQMQSWYAQNDPGTQGKWDGSDFR